MPPAADYKPAFHRLRKMARGAWARLIVDAISERLAIQGVSTTAGEATDEQAWGLLVSNRLDADQRDVYTEAFITGLSYVSLAATENGVTITPETCLEVTHLASPGDRRSVDAALKLIDMGRGGWQIELYTRALTAIWQTNYRDTKRSPLTQGAAPNWDDEPLILPNQSGQVPFVPFENRPTVAMPSLSELDELVPIMRRIQELELAKMIGVYTVTFPQKYATGLVVARDPETGRPLANFEGGPMRLWVSESPDTKFGAFPAGDIAQYLSAIADSVGELAAISRVPSYYFIQSNLSNPPSAESLVTSETGLVSKCLDRQRSFGESWEKAIRLSAALAGLEEVASDDQLSVVWHTPERRNPAVVADAATKISTVGVPWSEVMAFLGFSPTQIARMRVEVATEALLAPPPPAVVPAA